MRCLAIVLLFISPAILSAEVVEIQILHREPFAEGKTFGETGPYERLTGIVKFTLDPKHPRNARIVDLDKAPVNKDGKVEFQSDFFLLTPKDPTKRNGSLLYDVNNRGRKLALGFFNEGPSSGDPKSDEDAGNGFLMRRGYTLAWCGWLGELLPGAHRMMMQAPIATDNGKPITGITRFEFSSDVAEKSMPIARRPGHGSYNPTAKGEKEGTLTWRLKESDPRQPISRDQWKLERIAPAPVPEGTPGTLSQVRCHLEGGFQPGVLYELICEVENPIVQGVGLAAVRDLVSFLKYDTSAKNPLAVKGKSTIQRTICFGISQSGRFQRHFLYEGFNADEKDRIAFDGMIPHVAGGGLGFFNHRFAQPTRHNAQHEDHLYPNDIFPFTYGDEQHAYYDLNGKVVKDDRVDGILHWYKGENAKFIPKIMHTQSSSEYWHRSGSLVHTDPIGTRDSVIPENVRIYSFGGTQHGPVPFPPKGGVGVNPSNPGNFKPVCRALLVALDDWIRDGKLPPASVYPRVGPDLATVKDAANLFPKIPGVQFPNEAQQPSFLDLGPDFPKTHIITQEPPRVVGHYRTLVPTCDKGIGHERGMLDPPEVNFGIATFTGWNLRKKEIGAEGMLLNLQGSYLPLARTTEEAKAKGDPRPALDAIYKGYDDYKAGFQNVCKKYVESRWLLAEDVDRLVADRLVVLDAFIDPKEPLLEPGSRLERMVDSCKFTEGPAADKEGNVFFSDGGNNRIMKLTPEHKLSEFRKPSGRTNGMAFDHEGRLIMCQSTGEGGGRKVARLEKDGMETVLADAYEGKQFYAPNDVCVDAKGRIYFTDMNVGKEKGPALASAVYRIDEPGKPVRVINDLGRPNGLALSPDGKLLYVSDRSTQKLHRYKVKENGDVEADGIVYDFSPDRGIDGMRIDEKGNIWAAAGEGKTTGLFVVSPEGKLLLHHPVPEFSTNLVFAGKDNKDLYFTAMTSVYKFRTTIPGRVLPGRK